MMQNAAETSAEDSAQNADSDDLEGSIQYLDDSAQTNNSDAQQVKYYRVDTGWKCDIRPGVIGYPDFKNEDRCGCNQGKCTGRSRSNTDSQRATALIRNYDVGLCDKMQRNRFRFLHISSSQIEIRSLSAVVNRTEDKWKTIWNISTNISLYLDVFGSLAPNR